MPHILLFPFTNSPLLPYAVSAATPCAMMFHRTYLSCVLRARVQLPDELKHLRSEARSVICPPLRWCEHPWSPTFPSSINGATLIRELWNTRNRLPEVLWPVFFRMKISGYPPGTLLVSVTLGVTTSRSVCTVRTTDTSGSTCKWGVPVDLLNSICRKKVKQCRYRPGVAQRVPESYVPRFHDNSTGWW
jgi:hypothetical protein